MRNAIICNYNIITPFGIGLQKNMESIEQGKSCIKHIESHEYGIDFPLKYWGRVDWNAQGFNSQKQISKSFYIADKLVSSINPTRAQHHLDAVFVLINEFESLEGISKLKNEEYRTYQDVRQIFDHRDTLKYILQERGFIVARDKINIINNTCSSGVCMMGFARQGIQHLSWDKVLVLAIDPVDPLSLISLFNLGALSVGVENPEEASRPFDKARNGFVKSDGAAVALIVSEEQWEKNEKIDPPLIIRGFCQTSDAYRLTDGREDAFCAQEAMNLAIKRSNLLPHQISFVKTHGTSTRLNDHHEALAIEKVFEHVSVPVASFKGHLGHTTDASGLVETLLAGYAFQNNRILPIRNLTNPEYNLNFVLKTQAPETNFFLSNNFGFGGNNASIVIEKKLI